MEVTGCNGEKSGSSGNQEDTRGHREKVGKDKTLHSIIGDNIGNLNQYQYRKHDKDMIPNAHGIFMV